MNDPVPPKRIFPEAKVDARSARHVPSSPQTESEAYKLAFQDTEFLLREDLRPVRFQLELLKPELLMNEANIASTMVFYGSARIPEPSKADALVAAAHDDRQRYRRSRRRLRRLGDEARGDVVGRVGRGEREQAEQREEQAEESSGHRRRYISLPIAAHAEQSSDVAQRGWGLCLSQPAMSPRVERAVGSLQWGDGVAVGQPTSPRTR